MTWHDEGIFTVDCEKCGNSFPTSCTGFVVCAGCLNAEDRHLEANRAKARKHAERGENPPARIVEL